MDMKRIIQRTITADASNVNNEHTDPRRDMLTRLRCILAAMIRHTRERFNLRDPSDFRSKTMPDQIRIVDYILTQNDYQMYDPLDGLSDDGRYNNSFDRWREGKP